jgi:DNA polymerase-3 subunit alpha
MDHYRKTARDSGAVSIGSVLSDFAGEEGPQLYQDGQRMRLAGVVTSVKRKTSRNNRLIAYVTLEDDTSALEVLCFERTLEESGALLQEGKIVLLEGRISVRDEKPPQMLVDRAWSMDNGPVPQRRIQDGWGYTDRKVWQPSAPPVPTDELPLPPDAQGSNVPPAEPRRPGKVYVRVPTLEDVRVKKIKQYLVMFPGSDRLVLCCADSGKRYAIACMAHPSLTAALERLCGGENVVVKRN